MPKKRFTPEWIAFAPRPAEVGTAAGKVCRTVGMSEGRRLKQLEAENGKLQALDGLPNVG